MDRGLQQLLEEIRKHQGHEVLVNRYLALASEIKEEKTKSERVLDLAEALLGDVPREAMRIAHMVFRFDRRSTRALGIVAGCLEKLGRHAKAAIIRNEIDKIGQLPASESAVDDTSGKTLPAELFSAQPPADEGDSGDDERFPEIDLALGFEVSGKRSREASPPAPSTPPGPRVSMSAPRADSEAGRDLAELGAIKISDDDEDIDDDYVGDAPDLPPLREDSARGNTAESDASDEPFPAPGLGVPLVLRLDESKPGAAPPPSDDLARRTRFSVPPMRPHSTPAVAKEASPAAPRPLEGAEAGDLAAAVELFDYYWQQGFFDQAVDLLRQTRDLARDKAWWQGRRLLLEQKLGPLESRWVPSAVASGGRRMEFSALRASLEPELGAAVGAVGQQLPASDLRTAVGRAFDDDLIQRLVDAVSAMRGADVDHRVLWEVVSGVFGFSPGEDALAFMERVRSDFDDPRLWGFALDCLVAAGRPHEAIAEVRRVVLERSDMAWARTAYARLPRIWTCAEVRGFEWKEEDGMARFRELIRKRAVPCLQALVATGLSEV